MGTRHADHMQRPSSNDVNRLMSIVADGPNACQRMRRKPCGLAATRRGAFVRRAPLRVAAKPSTFPHQPDFLAHPPPLPRPTRRNETGSAHGGAGKLSIESDGPERTPPGTGGARYNGRNGLRARI